MKIFTIFILTIFLSTLLSCTRDRRFNEYAQIVDNSDKIVFYSRNLDTFSVTKSVEDFEHLQNLKKILTRNIKPDKQRKFVAQNKIEFYRQKELLGVLLISGLKENPFVNFTSDTFGFGFKLTYGLGMSL